MPSEAPAISYLVNPMTTTILQGDNRVLLPTRPTESVQMVCSSPAYFNQRDYGMAEQIGLEPTPSAYVTEMVRVFRQVHRVLRPDGTVWLNLGDTYSAGGRGGNGIVQSTNRGTRELQPLKVLDIAPKQLLGMPWRVAFALQNDGWWIRKAIIWHKPNPMCESAKDRPTSSYEFVFLLSKSARYYYDADAIAQPSVKPADTMRQSRKRYLTDHNKMRGGSRTYPFRNARDVWTIAPEPYAGPHFATMPTELARRCILAGSRPGDTVLDPFGGIGTTAVAADQLGRDAILIELNPAYVELAHHRLQCLSTIEQEIGHG
jgi:DNA modification methylase